MDIWAQRGKLLLTIALVALGLTYLLERIVFHAVVGFGSIVTTLVITLVLAGLGYLITRGQGWPRWIIALFLLLNSLGSPAGLADAVGPTGATLISLFLLVANLGTAVLLCFAPGIPAYLRYRRAQRSSRTQPA